MNGCNAGRLLYPFPITSKLGIPLLVRASHCREDSVRYDHNCAGGRMKVSLENGWRWTSLVRSLSLEGSVGDSPSLALSVVGWRVYLKIGSLARMRGSDAKPWSNPYRKTRNFSVGIINPAMSCFVRERRRDVLRAPRVSTKLTESRSRMQKLLKNLVGHVGVEPTAR
jgi:hypothetical protein